MTKADAIKILDPETSRDELEKQMCGIWAHEQAVELIADAQKLAISALRAQETTLNGTYVSIEWFNAVKAELDALKAKRPAKLDRSRWEGCDICNNTPGIMFGVITMAIGKCFLSTDEHELKYCPKCGKPLTEEAWAALEGRISDG